MYKPERGEAPLWDFPGGTLFRRECAMYELARSLDRVMIESVEIETEDLLAAEGDIAVWYENNGRCTPYVVTLVDEEGATVEIEVDAFSTPTTTALQ